MDKTKITMYLPVAVAKKFKVFCAETGMPYGDWVEKWLMEEAGAGAGTIAEKELEGLKDMMAVANPQARAEHLAKWLVSPAAKAIGDDPFRRGEFAKEAGMTAAELGEWNETFKLESVNKGDKLA